MKTINQLVKEQKANNEETEFYPTTQEIVNEFAEMARRGITRDNGRITSILDIGCGNGAFFTKLQKTGVWDSESSKCHHCQMFGIEKSSILVQELPENIILLGTDFYQNSLIDKKVDVIFCNPPYSQYEEWTAKIIREGNFKSLALVIPSRWRNSGMIEEALKARKLNATTLGTYDFSDAERKARAVVELIWINTSVYDYVDPFDLWFDNSFKIDAETSKYQRSFNSDKAKIIEDKLVDSTNISEMLVKFYNDDMQKLLNNYKSLENLDRDLLKEIHVNIQELKESLKTRISGLKNLYWDMLFKRYDKITKRLTSKGRKRVTQKLSDNTCIDFTLENIFTITLWLIKNSNTMFDSQLTDFFFELCSPDDIISYKSDRRWNDDSWRYVKQAFERNGCWGLKKDNLDEYKKNIMLDYRIVVSGYQNFTYDFVSEKLEGLSDRSFELLGDVCVIAENFGFDVDTSFLPDNPKFYGDEKCSKFDWNNFDIKMKNGEILCNVKLYKNGNKHFKFNKAFMQKLNIEMARINHWINSKDEAEKETGYSKADINKVWNCNVKISMNDTKFLGLPEAI